jgi:uncharacterized membrane protein
MPGGDASTKRTTWKPTQATGCNWSRRRTRPIPTRASIAQRCVSCHAEKPTQEGFAVAPKDVKLDTAERITANAQKIYEQAVATKAMPIGNLTGMTDAERAKIAAWLAAGPGR